MAVEEGTGKAELVVKAPRGCDAVIGSGGCNGGWPEAKVRSMILFEELGVVAGDCTFWMP